MKIVVNGRQRKVIDVQIVYDTVSYSNKYYYFIHVKYEGTYFCDWVVIDVFRNPGEAIERYEYLKNNINADLVIVR